MHLASTISLTFHILEGMNGFLQDWTNIISIFMYVSSMLMRTLAVDHLLSQGVKGLMTFYTCTDYQCKVQFKGQGLNLSLP